MSATESGFGNVKEFFKSTDIGAVIGVGGVFGQGQMKGLVDLRYVFGFTNNYAAEFGYTMKTAVFVLTGGIIF